ncbi:MAG: dephospho-CoA kinase [Thiobacillaceae bacterium]|nr:dephospho-CoA kinase [Thiobacillaceae bacterium]
MNRRPFCVALTGGIAAGKSLVAARFAQLGVPVLDTDAIARELTTVGGAALPAIAAAFGARYLTPDGALDRAAMRALVFADSAARRRLEAILHPMILAVVRERLARTQAAYVLLVVPLLAETWDEYRPLVDRVLVVDCDPAQQIERLITRDGIDAELAKRMLAAQAGRTERLALADDVIDNRGTVTALSAAVDRLHALYLQLSAAAPPLSQSG